MDFALSKEQELLRAAVREFAQKEMVPMASEIDRSATFPKESAEKMAKMGLFGMTVPPPFGGSGAGLVSHLVAVEELSAACASTAMILASQVMAERGLLMFGTDAQKTKYLPSLAKGEKTSSVAMTEAVASSDFAALEFRAKQEGDKYILNGSKIFTCNAENADVIFVLARTTEALGASGLSLLIVEKGTRGLDVGKKEDKFGVRGVPSNELIFEDCVIPRENLLGREGMGLVQAISMGTPTVLTAGMISVGIARAAMEAAVRYAKQRKAFDQTIGNLEAVQFMIGDMATSIDASRLLLFRAAASVDKGQPNPIENFKAKIFSGEMAIRVTNNAMQVFGGYGYTKEYPLERYCRDARAFTLYPLASELYKALLGRMLFDLPLPWKGMPPMGPPGGPPRPAA
jgi:alkylation response protein AidB-like acyl-CoA dehydrogenase